jgi:hypothetical protein
LSVEEQGRASLHMHIQIWVARLKEWIDQVHSAAKAVQNIAAKRITEFMDTVGSSALFDFSQCSMKSGSFGDFPHTCTQPEDELRGLPMLVDDQHLRNLRHREGQHSNNKRNAHAVHMFGLRNRWWNLT